MAELTSNASSPEGMFGTKAGPKSCKSESANGSAGTSSQIPNCPQCGARKSGATAFATYQAARFSVGSAETADCVFQSVLTKGEQLKLLKPFKRRN